MITETVDGCRPPEAVPDPDLAVLLGRIRGFGRTHPEAPAVAVQGKRWTYRELAGYAARVADALRLGPCDRVGILCEPGLEPIVAMLASLLSGAAYVPLEAALPPIRLGAIAVDARLTALVSGGSLQSWLPLRGAPVPLDVDGLDLLALRISSAPHQEGPVPHPEHLAYVMYTSGSTGLPKGVMVSRRCLANYLNWCVDAYGAGTWTEALVGSSLAVDLTITGLFAPLCRGGCVTMLNPRDGTDGWIRALQEARGSCLVKIAPAQLKLILPRLTPELAQKVAVLVIGGEALAWQTVKEWQRLSPVTRVFNEYGPTETVVGCTAYEANAATGSGIHVPIGRPIANASVYVVDSALTQCAPSVAGELWIGGVGVAHGYLGNPALTAERFVPDLFSTQRGARAYRSGDLGRWDDAGMLEFLGRRDDQLKIRGYRVEPAEIESVLVTHPAVIAAAVVLAAVPGGSAGALSPAPAIDASKGEVRRFTKPEVTEPRLAAYLVVRGDEPPTFNSVRRFAADHLPAYMVPAVFVIVPRLPLLTSGKIDRKALTRGVGRELAPAAAADPPRDEIEARMCEIFADVLRVASVGVHDNFFELGADSIHVIGIHARARALGLDVELADFFKHQTIADLVRHCRREPRNEGAPARSAPFAMISAEDRALLPAGVEDAYPLARMQAGLIFHSQESDTSSNYHDVFVYEIRSRFEDRTLAAALSQVVQCHPILRTSFGLTGFREPLQLVWPDATPEMRVHDLRLLPADGQRQTLMAAINAEKCRPFDWRQAPMLRLHLYRTADDVAHWMVSFHDSVLDGWSVATLLVELLRRYASELEGTTLAAAPLAASYRDFVERERGALHDDRQRAFWHGYLEGASTAALIAPARRATQPGRRTKVVEVDVPADLSDALQAVARMLHVPFKHVLLAAHVYVAAWISGQSDVVTGVESHARLDEPDGDRVLGMHLNTLPLRVTLAGGTWGDLIESVKEAERAILPYRRYPYAAIHRDQGGASLFTTVFNYTHFRVLREIGAIPGIEGLGGCGFGERHYALSAEFNQDPYTGHLRLDLECNLEVHDADYWQIVKRGYEQTIRAIASDPETRYDLASPVDTADTTASAPPRVAPTVLELWAEQIRNAPNATAIVHGEHAMTYAELDRAARDIAWCLSDAGAERRVAICLDAGHEQIAAMWGVLLAGHAYVPIDPDLPPARVRQVLADARAWAVISTPTLRDRVVATGGALGGVQWLVDRAQRPFRATGARPLPQPHPDELAYVIYTSGSTGTPKGVHVTHGNLAYSTAVRKAYYTKPAGRFLLVPTLACDSSVAVIFWTLCTGGTLVMPVGDERRDAQRLAALVRQHGITSWLSVPSLYEAVLRGADTRALASLRCAIVAGERCPSRVAALHRERTSADLFNEYGPSEATVWATVWRVGEDPTESTIPIGVPIAGARVYLLDAHLRPVGPGVTGEVYIGGPGVSRGYTGGAATAGRFVPDPFAQPTGSRMYRTGDLARRLRSGVLEFAGRVDRQVKIRGYRVEPEDVEDVIRQSDAVSEVSVIAFDDGHDKGARLVAYVVAANQSASAASLRRFCNGRLPAPLVPSSFVLLDELPRTRTGKVDIRYLAELRPGLYDSTAIERALAQVEAMEPREVGVMLGELSRAWPAVNQRAE